TSPELRLRRRTPSHLDSGLCPATGPRVAETAPSPPPDRRLRSPQKAWRDRLRPWKAQKVTRTFSEFSANLCSQTNPTNRRHLHPGEQPLVRQRSPSPRLFLISVTTPQPRTRTVIEECA